MNDVVQVRLEHCSVWEPFFKNSQFNEDAIKEFLRYHREYYVRSIEVDGYKELSVEVRDKNQNIKKYDVYIDNFYTFFIKESEKTVL